MKVFKRRKNSFLVSRLDIEHSLREEVIRNPYVLADLFAESICPDPLSTIPKQNVNGKWLDLVARSFNTFLTDSKSFYRFRPLHSRDRNPLNWTRSTRYCVYTFVPHSPSVMRVMGWICPWFLKGESFPQSRLSGTHVPSSHLDPRKPVVKIRIVVLTGNFVTDHQESLENLVHALT